MSLMIRNNMLLDLISKTWLICFPLRKKTNHIETIQVLAKHLASWKRSRPSRSKSLHVDNLILKHEAGPVQLGSSSIKDPHQQDQSKLSIKPQQMLLGGCFPAHNAVE